MSVTYDIKQVTRYVLIKKDASKITDVAEFPRRDEAETALAALDGGRDVLYSRLLPLPVEFIEKDGMFLAVPDDGVTAEELRGHAQRLRDHAPKLLHENDQTATKVMSALVDLLADRIAV